MGLQEAADKPMTADSNENLHSLSPLRLCAFAVKSCVLYGLAR